VIDAVTSLAIVWFLIKEGRKHGQATNVSTTASFRELLRPIVEFTFRTLIARLRESRRPTPVLQPRVPPDVIDMQMRAHDEIDIVVDMSGRNVSVRLHALQSLNQSPFECVDHVVSIDTVGSLYKACGRQLDGRGPSGSAGPCCVPSSIRRYFDASAECDHAPHVKVVARGLRV